MEIIDIFKLFLMFIIIGIIILYRYKISEIFLLDYEVELIAIEKKEFEKILEFAKQEKIIIYGQNKFDTNKTILIPIPINHLIGYDWSKDYKTLNFPNSNWIAYSNISIKQKDLNNILGYL